MKKAIILLTAIFVVLVLLVAASASTATKSAVMQKMKTMQVPFISNDGQTDKAVLFYAKTFGGTVFITKKSEIVYSLFQETTDLNGEDTVTKLRRHAFAEKRQAKGTQKAKALGLKEELIGSKIRKVQGEGESITKVNYFMGKDPSKWRRNLSTYEFVNLGEVYKGIELKLRAYGANVEKLFHVKPGGSPELIKVKITGAKRLRVNDRGELEADTDLGAVRFTKPIAYQEVAGKRVDVSVDYRIQKPARNTQYVYGFEVGEYDRSRELVIDPLLASTFLGGRSSDVGMAILYGYEVYVAGLTRSLNFPTTLGAYDIRWNGNYDGFVSRLDPSLTTLLASTYIGGRGFDGVNAITVAYGDIFVAGLTRSGNFPTTPGAYDRRWNGNYDGFVSRLDPSLSTLLASTYIGGKGSDGVNAIAIGLGLTGSDDFVVYVAGSTGSTNYPTTPGAYDTGRPFGFDAFVSKLNNGLTTLLASTYIGGKGWDGANGIISDLPARTVYITGGTGSFDYPTTLGAYDTTFNGGWGVVDDVFVSELDSDLATLLASTYIGGSFAEEAHGIALDSQWEAFPDILVTGQTWSFNYPVTPGAYDTSFNGGFDAFISRLDSTLSSLVNSTFIGGSKNDAAEAIAVAPFSGNVFVTGWTESLDYPTTPGAFDTSFNGGVSDVFVSAMNSTLSSLDNSTFIGGSKQEGGHAITIDEWLTVFITGDTASFNYPTTPGAYDITYNDNGGYYDVFVSRFSPDL